MFSRLDFVREEIHNIPSTAQKPQRVTAFKYFFGRLLEAIKLVLFEKEIIVFAILQWIVIGIGYYLWVQILGWIPDDVWRSVEESDSSSIVDIILLIWSFIIVGLVAFPLGILTACIGTVHFLHRQGRPSTIAACLQVVLPRAKNLWMFHWIDGWITVRQILDRLPKKRNWPPSKLEEALYYAWKLGTIGIPPALLSGRGLIEAGKESVLLVKNKAIDTTLLRTGYSFVCWIVGISAYIGTIFFFIHFNHLIPTSEVESFIYEFYFWAGIPIFVAVGIIQLLIRPIYILASADIYADSLEEQKKPLLLPPPPSKFTSVFVAFTVLLLIVVVVFLFRDELGITNLLSTPYS